MYVQEWVGYCVFACARLWWEVCMHKLVIWRFFIQTVLILIFYLLIHKMNASMLNQQVKCTLLGILFMNLSRQILVQNYETSILLDETIYYCIRYWVTKYHNANLWFASRRGARSHLKIKKSNALDLPHVIHHPKKEEESGCVFLIYI